jgi:hypothetical protein
MAYAVLNQPVPHADLETCPGQFNSAANFCCLTLTREQAHVLVFSCSGISCCAR